MSREHLPAQLAELALQVPPEIRAELPRWELVARVYYVQSLHERAEWEPPEVAGQTRVTASRVLTSMPLERYLDAVKGLGDEMAAASAAEDHDEAGRVFARLHRLQRENPEIPAAVWTAAGFTATADELTAMNKLAIRVLRAR